MKKITVDKINKWWYVRVWHADGTLCTQASFPTRKAAREARDHWISDKLFGEAVEG